MEKFKILKEKIEENSIVQYIGDSKSILEHGCLYVVTLILTDYVYLKGINTKESFNINDLQHIESLSYENITTGSEVICISYNTGSLLPGDRFIAGRVQGIHISPANDGTANISGYKLHASNSWHTENFRALIKDEEKVSTNTEPKKLYKSNKRYDSIFYK